MQKTKTGFRSSLFLLIPAFYLLISFTGSAQSSYGILKGRVTDGASRKSMATASITTTVIGHKDTTAAIGHSDTNTVGHRDSTGARARRDTATSFANGEYILKLAPGSYDIVYQSPGFQTRVITGVPFNYGEPTYIDIVMMPVAQGAGAGSRLSSDSLPTPDTLQRLSFHTAFRGGAKHPEQHADGDGDHIPEENIGAGTDKDGAQLLKRLPGVIIQDDPGQKDLQTLNISGMGERYNQVIFNGAILNSYDPSGKAFPLDMLPAEAISEVSLQRTGNAALPGNFTGGTVSIRTRDLPEGNFFYIRAGGGSSDGTAGKDFYGDRRGHLEWLGFPGLTRNLPPEFPNTRTPFSLNQKNPQEQVFLSKTLGNNLAPVNHGSSLPDDQLTLGYGRSFRLKKGERIGILAYIRHEHAELIDQNVVQTMPDIPSNPFPFDANKLLIPSQSSDLNYRYSSRLAGMLNASIRYGRNKISWQNFFGNQFTNTYTRRSAIFKPDEDPLAHAGIGYRSRERRSFHSQLSGEHALGAGGKFRLDWQAAYTWYHLQDPGERNFLLRQDSTNPRQFALAVPVHPLDYSNATTIDPSFSNSGQLWRDLTEQDFSGSVNILVPFNLFNQAQVLSGGIGVQTRYRVFHSDLLFSQGPGYYPLDSLLAPSHYYPGGLGLQNYFINSPANLNFIYGNSWGNYTATANLGSAHIRWESRLTRRLSVDWGLRLESNSQLVSDTRYVYSAGYRYPQIVTNNQNLYVLNNDLLPSVQARYQLSGALRLHAAWFRSINRPELQELTDYRYYDASSFLVRTGNPRLINPHIRNYEAGIGWNPDARSGISISGFYKEIDQPIEYILSRYAGSVGNLVSKPQNSPPATIRGLNGEFRLNFGSLSPTPWLSMLSIFAGGNLLDASVTGGPVRSTETPDVSDHKLSESPDYTVNAGLVLQHPRLPMLTLLYSRTGDYLMALGSGAVYTLPGHRTLRAIPDYRVQGRERLDIQVSQKLFRSSLQLVAGVKNLLGSDYIIYQDLNGNNKFDKPLTVTTGNGHAGYFLSGVDNTITRIREQRNYYFTLSYLF